MVVGKYICEDKIKKCQAQGPSGDCLPLSDGEPLLPHSTSAYVTSLVNRNFEQ